MNSIALEIALILTLVLANGFFAMAEIAVVSARKARLQQRENEGDKKAQVALALANAPNEFLSTTQIEITLIGTLAGAFGGATVAEALSAYLKEIPAIAPYAASASITIVVVAITYVSLVLGELVPKRIALNNPEGISAWIAPAMKALSRLAHPAVRLLGWSSDLVIRILPIRSSSEPGVTEEEIQVLIKQGTEAGIFEETEQEMVAGVFRLGDQRAVNIMTPRLRVAWLDVSASPQELRTVLTRSDHSHFPVCQDSLDRVLGVVSLRELLRQSLNGQPIDLRGALVRPLYLPEAMRALQILEQFQHSREHVALVVDEHGLVQGLVTATDILESIVGEFPSSSGGVESAAIVQREDGSWLVDGLIQIDELKEHLRISELPGESTGTFTTVGGFVMMHLEHIPQPAEHFAVGEWHFEVMDMEGNRVAKVLVSRQRGNTSPFEHLP
jgi:putative hemolysin